MKPRERYSGISSALQWVPQDCETIQQYEKLAHQSDVQASFAHFGR
jgi:hypothetical protein